jgi:dye decolorizing peroxidase
VSELSRRGLVAYGAAGGVVALGAAGLFAASRDTSVAPASALRRTYSPHDVHQAGIDTPAPAVTTAVAYDLASGIGADALARLMRVWSSDIDALMAGRGGLGDPTKEISSAGMSLSITVGFGPRIFTLAGLAGKRPEGFVEIPALRTDKLPDRWSGGDLIVMVAADDETSVAHAERVLTRDAATFASVRWRQTGFWRGYDANGSPATGRNLFGQVDGTANPSGDTMARAVWVDDDSWMAGGTTMMLRRFELNLNVWDTLTRERQEKVVGRNLTNGAPLTGVAERDVMDLAAKDADGQYVIAANAHSRLAHPDTNSGRRMLRRGLNYVHDEDGRRTSGLMFIAFVRSIAGQLTPVLQRLDQTDALNEWTTPIGSSIWAFPGGYPQGSWLAQRLFDA